MRPVNPEPRCGTNLVVIAKGQPQYIPLPANASYPCVETKWQLSWKERLLVLFGGSLYLIIMNFRQPLQPVKLCVERPDEI